MEETNCDEPLILELKEKIADGINNTSEVNTCDNSRLHSCEQDITNDEVIPSEKINELLLSNDALPQDSSNSGENNEIIMSSENGETKASTNDIVEENKLCDDFKERLCFPSYCFDDFIEITNSTKPFISTQYLVGCKWSPDGTCLMTNCADYKIRLFDLPSKLYNKQHWQRNEILPELQQSLEVTEGGQIYDYEWYPFMSSWSPDTCCFLTTSTKAPVHLWDAYSGNIRANYCGYNRYDETDNAYSVKFSLNGEKIYAGYKNEIKIFDTSIPGRKYTNIDTKHTAGQTGIISCIAENPGVPNMFAAGSYARTIGLYLECGDSICLLSGQRGGITHIMWSCDGVYLISGARKDNEIVCWDIRNPGEVLCSMKRTVSTNQRIYFDMTPDGKYLVSGSTSGETIIWDLNKCAAQSGERESSFKFQPHTDCTNGVSVHRQLPLLATSSGQHHFPDLTSDDDDNIFDVKTMILRIENCVKLWWIGPTND